MGLLEHLRPQHRDLYLPVLALVLVILGSPGFDQYLLNL
jgi:hypothetical protein